MARSVVGRDARHGRSEHIVQFFDSAESRAENVARFLAEGHEQGEIGLLVVGRAHKTLILEWMETLGVRTKEAITTGRLVVLDGVDTLGRISSDGDPDSVRFENLFGSLLPRLAGSTGLRAYGEMVDILAEQNEIPGAIRLERLWNRAAERVTFKLMCGYSSAHFVGLDTHRGLLEICRSHTAVRQHVHDPLGSWLLQSAGHMRPATSQ